MEMNMTNFNRKTDLWIDQIVVEYRDKGYTASPIVYRDPFEASLAREFLRVAKFQKPVCATYLSNSLTLMVICPTSNDDGKSICEAVKKGKQGAIDAMNPN